MAFNITERTLANSDDWPYGYWYDIDTATGNWQDGSDLGAFGFLQLYDTGCVTGNDTWNCTAACLDTTLGPELVWNTSGFAADAMGTGMYTFQNCIVLPVIASLLAASSLTPYAVSLAEKYNIQADAGLVNSSAGWPVINNCINQFCEGNSESVPGCNTNKNVNDDIPKYYLYLHDKDAWDHWDGNKTISSVNISSDFFNSGICYHLDAVINGDIGGIGMFVSYLMQMLIVLSAWILFHFYETWAAWPLTLLLLPIHGTRRASQLAQQAQNDIRASKHTAALVSALDEFQKAQIFFMLAVQIAALIALHNPAYVEANSWQQLWNNIGILFNLAFGINLLTQKNYLGGCLPVIFTMLIKRLAGITAVYTLAVSTACMAVSSATWFLTFNKTQKGSINPDTSIKYEGPPIPQCAGVPPIKYCYQYGWFSTNSDATVKAIPMLVFCWVVQLCLILDAANVFPITDEHGAPARGSCFVWLEQKLLSRPFWTTYDETHFNRSRWLTLFRLDTGAHMVHMAQSLIILAAEIVFVGLNAILLTDYAHILIPNDFKTLNLKDWTLGQVIAVTIWVPVFLEYVYVAAGGPEEIAKGRLHHDYEVVKKTPSRAPTFDQEKLGGSSSVELTKLDPVTRPGYERVDSNMALLR